MSNMPINLPQALAQLDPRTTEDIYHQVLQLARHYCPDWDNIQQNDIQNIDEQDLGVVLLKLFAQLGHTLARRTDQLPQKQLFSFYQFMGLDLLTPTPAQALLSFELDADTDDIVTIPTGTQVASGKDQKVVYETTSALNASHVPMSGAYILDSDTDQYLDISSKVLGRTQPFKMFVPSYDANTDPCPVKLKHEMYLASELFQFNTPADLTITLVFGEGPPEGLPGALQCQDRWQWLIFDDQGNETPLAPCSFKINDGLIEEDNCKQSHNTQLDAETLTNVSKGQKDTEKARTEEQDLTNQDTLTVSFESVLFHTSSIDECTNYWLGIRLDPVGLNAVSQPIDTDLDYFPPGNLIGQESAICGKVHNMNFDLNANNVPWDALFVNDSQVSAEKGFYIFGKTPETNDNFYLGSLEAFKPGFQVTLEIDFNPGVGSYDLEVAWEYWDGIRWQAFDIKNEFEQVIDGQILDSETLDFTKPGKLAGVAPTDRSDNSANNGGDNRAEILQAENTDDTEDTEDEGSGDESPQINMTLTFTCPEDIKPSTINEISSYWIRVKILDGNYGERYHLTPISLEESETLQDALDEASEALSQGWTDDVFPSQSEFLLAKLIELSQSDNPVDIDKIRQALFEFIQNSTTETLPESEIETIVNEIIKTIQDWFANIQTVQVSSQQEIIHYSGLDVIDPSLDDNMYDYLSGNLQAKTVMEFINEQGWTLSSPGNCIPPYMAGLRLSYNKQAATFSRVCTDNNFTVASQNISYTNASDFTPFFPFYLVTGLPCFYLGFEQQATQQQWNAWFSFAVPFPTTQQMEGVSVVVEYLSEGLWLSLSLETDQTSNLSQSGMIAWKLPHDSELRTLFNRDVACYWTRFRLQEVCSAITAVKSQPLPQVEKAIIDLRDQCSAENERVSYTKVEMKGIYPNSAWAKDYTSHYNQVIGSSNENADQTFQITPYLVYSGQQIDIREATYPDPEQAKVIQLESGQDAIREIDGANGKEIWVRWSSVANLALSGPKSRHYTIHYETGSITFGDGVQGMIPPGLKNNIMATFYRRGNSSTDLAATGELNKLVQQQSGVKSATNYEAAIGKKQQESQRQFLVRTPESLKTRDRASSLHDFQFLAIQASNLIARAKSYQIQDDPETINVIIVPNNNYGNRYPGADLSESVLLYLQQRALPTLSESIKIHAPEYVGINIITEITINIGFTPVAVRAALKERLTRFFDPVQGQSNGHGWPFGSVIFSSQVSAEIQNEEGIEQINFLQMTSSEPKADDQSDSDQVSSTPQSSISTDLISATSTDELGQIKLDERALPIPGNFIIQINANNQEESQS